MKYRFTGPLLGTVYHETNIPPPLDFNAARAVLLASYRVKTAVHVHRPSSYIASLMHLVAPAVHLQKAALQRQEQTRRRAQAARPRTESPSASRAESLQVRPEHWCTYEQVPGTDGECWQFTLEHAKMVGIKGLKSRRVHALWLVSRKEGAVIILEVCRSVDIFSRGHPCLSRTTRSALLWGATGPPQRVRPARWLTRRSTRSCW